MSWPAEEALFAELAARGSIAQRAPRRLAGRSTAGRASSSDRPMLGRSSRLFAADREPGQADEGRTCRAGSGTVSRREEWAHRGEAASAAGERRRRARRAQPLRSCSARSGCQRREPRTCGADRASARAQTGKARLAGRCRSPISPALRERGPPAGRGLEPAARAAGPLDRAGRAGWRSRRRRGRRAGEPGPGGDRLGGRAEPEQRAALPIGPVTRGGTRPPAAWPMSRVPRACRSSLPAEQLLTQTLRTAAVEGAITAPATNAAAINGGARRLRGAGD